MKASGGLHHPARSLAETRLTSPTGQLLKTDLADAATIFKEASERHVRFVPVNLLARPTEQ
jgi:hypothetical protein